MKWTTTVLLFLCCVPALPAQEYAFTPYGPDRGMPSGIVTDIVQDHRGFIWASLAGRGVRRLDGKQSVMPQSRSWPLPQQVFALATDGARHLFIGSGEGICAVRLEDDANDSVDLPLSELLRDIPAPVRRLEMSGLRQLYMETPLGCWQLDLRDSSLVRVRERPPNFTAMAGLFPGEVLRDKATDCLKRSWLATDRGLLLHDDMQVRRFDTSNGLPDEDVRAVFVDREANVWCGTARGLFHFVPARATNFTSGASLPADLGAVHCMLELRNRSVWIGGDGGVLRLFDGDMLHLTESDGLPANAVRCMLELPSGEILLGTDRGLILHGDKGFSPVPATLVLPGTQVTAMLRSAEQVYWIATRSGLLRWDGKNQRVFTITDGLPSNDIMALAEDAYGLIWVGTRSGLARISSGRNADVQRFPELERIPVQALHVDDRDRLWIGTEGAGVFVRGGRETVQLTGNDGLKANAIRFIISDNYGSLYFGTGSGVTVLPRSNIQFLLPVDSAQMFRPGMVFAHLPFLRATAMYTLGMSTGFLSDNYALGAVMRDGAGLLWFAGSRGISSYNPPRPLPYGRWQPPLCRPVLSDGSPAIPYRIILASLCVNDTCTAQRGSISLGPDDHVLRASLLLPSFRNRGDVRFLYQLEGMEYSWHTSVDGEILYTGIPPGSYVLTVQAYLGEGVWSKRVRLLEIHVAAAFYERSWFWIILIAVAFLLGYLAQKQRYAWLLARERKRSSRERGDMFYNPN